MPEKIKILCLLLLCFWTTQVWAEDSLIDVVLKAQESIVTVRAVRTEIHKTAAGPKLVTFNKTGAGVIIEDSGFIVTNYHTIRLAKQLGVRLFDGKSAGATIVHLMPEHDLALIQIEPPYPLSPILFANSDNVRLGDQIVNIGNSQYLKQTISGGKVTGLGRMKNADGAQYNEIIEVNIDLYQGDSGGPLLDHSGHLIGMMAAELKSKQKASFAIPSNKIKKLYFDFMKTKYNR